MRLHTGLLAAIFSISVAVLACAAPTPGIVLPGMLPRGNEVLKDDFNANLLGWDIFLGDEGVANFENGQYFISVKKPFTEIWANPDAKYPIPNDVIIEVQSTNTASQDNYFGIICRYQNNNNYYFLVVSTDGYYGIGKVKDGNHTLVNRNEMPPNDTIKDRISLALHAECTGNRLALFADGILLDEQIDSDFTQGGVGIIAGSYEEEVSIYFDNFTVFGLGP